MIAHGLFSILDVMWIGEGLVQHRSVTIWRKGLFAAAAEVTPEFWIFFASDGISALSMICITDRV